MNAFREILRRKTRTKQGRAETDSGQKISPIESPDDIDRLVLASHEEAPEAHLFILLCLDAGLRWGEALGLRWGAVKWGEDENDTHRGLVISESRPRGGEPGPTKSGRTRHVALSRRLHRALSRYYLAGFKPGPDQYVLPDRDPSVFRRVEWRRILKRAQIGHRAVKDLRDTYASQLLTAGVQLGYVSAQLGHSNVAITARHYARWVGGDTYREPMKLEPGEVPADLLARLHESPQSPPSFAPSIDEDASTRRNWWWSQRDLNPCLQGENLVS